MHTITLDWLAMTFKGITDEQAAFMDNYGVFGESDATKPTNGYTSACTGAFGVVHMWNANRTEMGHHVIFAGSALRDLFENGGVSQQALLAECLHVGARITRLDIACDAQEIPISLDSIYQALERGEYSGTARSFSQIHSINGGNTIYVGSRQSERFIRAYDKAAQMGNEARNWKRIELETKGMVSRAIATLLASSGDWSSILRTAIVAMVDLPGNRNFANLLPPLGAQIGIPKLEKKTDREKWIELQVMPAVVDHYVQNRNSEAVALLRRMLDQVDKMK